jgi:hypothetical protein
MFVCLFSIGVFVGVARADSFAINGSSCVPNTEATYNQSHLVSAGTIKYRTGKMNLIRFFCAIPSAITAPTHVAMTYTAPAGSRVSTAYVKLNKNDGTLEAIASAESTDTSAGVHVNDVPMPATEVYDPSTYLYFITIEMSRSSTTADVVFYQARVY